MTRLLEFFKSPPDGWRFNNHSDQFTGGFIEIERSIAMKSIQSSASTSPANQIVPGRPDPKACPDGFNVELMNGIPSSLCHTTSEATGSPLCIGAFI
jgi:hypothetical protein